MACGASRRRSPRSATLMVTHLPPKAFRSSLVSSVGNTLAKSREVVEDLVGGTGPHEGARTHDPVRTLRSTADVRSATLRWAPRGSHFVVSSASGRPTRFIQEL